MSTTKIEWADRVWNPVTGCTKVSRGCDHCYAENIAHRFAGTPAFPQGFEVTLHEDRLDAPLRWRKPSRVFVNSMSDLFHDQVPDQFLERVFTVMEQAGEQTFMVLTKRHGRMRSFLRARQAKREEYALKFENHEVPARRTCPAAKHARWRADNPPANIWLGVSVEDQKAANLRVPALLDTPAAVRFLSCEPLLGPVDLSWCAGVSALEPDWIGGPNAGSGAPHPLIDWVIAGGESGPGARPMHPDWARALRDQCAAAHVPFFFKQWGGWEPDPADGAGWADRPGRHVFVTPRGEVTPGPAFGPASLGMRATSKKDAGRALDGCEHEQFPQVTS